MGNPDLEAVAARISRAPYGDQFVRLFGAEATDSPQKIAQIALIAVAHFEVEDASFNRYNSKFDYWLEGKARFTPAEMRGYLAFNDPKRGNCGGCHVDAPRGDWLPPLLTDNQYEALAVPRNPELEVNRKADYFDLGICGPTRSDQQAQTQYCGMFRTPSLRNVAQRSVFFHNGRYHSLREVMEFYNFRDTQPERIYPRRADGSIDVFDDVPPQYRANVDVKDAPFDRKRGDAPPMSDGDMEDIIAFMKTLSDGYELPQ
jgi:cytochrome c peroxidase